MSSSKCATPSTRSRGSRHGCAIAASSFREASTSSPISSSATGSRGRSAEAHPRLLRSRARRSRSPRASCGTKTHLSGSRTRASRSARGSSPGQPPSTAMPSRTCATPSRGATCIRSISCNTCRRPSRGDPRALATRLSPLRPLHRDPFVDRPLGRRLRLARALPRPARRTDPDDADQGDAAARRGCGAARVGEGRGRARDDRRPRAQRPLAGVRSRAPFGGPSS